MRIIYLPRFWTILVDSVAWAIIQTGLAFLSFRFPDAVLDHRLWLYRTRPFEQGGEFYARVLRVRAWKGYLPSGGTLFGEFNMSEFNSREPEHLRMWVTESCRAELCHWLAVLPAPLFFLWNPVWLGIVMVVYAVAFNSVPIIVQRYNRPRLLEILAQMEAREP
jgi:glycosyl-4,4'-diaponeurosporenoate acyltransferase